MSSSFLKSSGWFLRSQHLKNSDENYYPRPDLLPADSPTVLLPEEEICIREYCPVTLNHLLPDLCYTHKQQVAELVEEFDASLRAKFQKHLEESHKDISGSSSTMNEDDYEEYSEGCIENEINMHILRNNNQLRFGSKKILKPHKVNYPDSNMIGRTLPYLTLNNGKSTTINPKTSTPKSISKRERSRNLNNAQKIVFPSVKKNRVEPLSDNRDCIYSKRNRKSTQEQNVETHRIKDNVLARVAPRIAVNRSLKSSQSQCDIPTLPPPNSPYYIQQSPQRRLYNSLCIQHRRTRSLSPFKQIPSFTRRISPPPQERTSCHIFPSPHLMELARLKKQELELEEKILLRERKKLELERLRPPAERWYEIKDYRFHQEAHKNNSYLKNGKILPLIQERRRLLLESLMTMDF